MGKSKQVCDILPGKGMTTSQSNEHLRKANSAASQKRWSGNYDPSREKLNFEVTKGGVIVPVNKKKSITRRIAEILKTKGIDEPNAGIPAKELQKKGIGQRTVANIILGGSREQMHRLAYGDQLVNLNRNADNSGITRQKAIEDWAVDVYNFMALKYGEDNIAAFVVHLDETNPHVHCTVLPIADNKLSWKKVFAGEDKFEYRRRTSLLHDEFAEINKKWGLERGDDIRTTGARHRSTEEYYRELEEQGKELKEELEQQQKQLTSLDDEIKKAERRVKGLTTMLSNLESQKVEIENEISQLETKALLDECPDDELMQQRAALNKDLEAINDKIKERREQLNKAQQLLQEALDQKADVHDSYIEISKKVEGEQRNGSGVQPTDRRSNAQTKIRELTSELWKELNEFSESSSLRPREQDVVNQAMANSEVIETLAEKTNEVMAISSALFLGYIDQATSFAQSHGGGGGGPSSGWGRDKDDDDEAWRRKCFFMGMKMMRPANRKRSVTSAIKR